MHRLAAQIAREIETRGVSAIYEPELSLVWPNGDRRKAQVAIFAKQHGWRLRHYKDGFVAIFDKEPPIV
jgi:hypothetical protein